MKYKYELTVTALWTIAILATLWITRGTDLFTFLGPLFFICMTGSIIVVRQSRCNTIVSTSDKKGTDIE
jgi:hypothetical protein